jgi:hypothetical protein
MSYYQYDKRVSRQLALVVNRSTGPTARVNSRNATPLKQHKRLPLASVRIAACAQLKRVNANRGTTDLRRTPVHLKRILQLINCVCGARAEGSASSRWQQSHRICSGLRGVPGRLDDRRFSNEKQSLALWLCEAGPCPRAEAARRLSLHVQRAAR